MFLLWFRGLEGMRWPLFNDQDFRFDSLEFAGTELIMQMLCR